MPRKNRKLAKAPGRKTGFAIFGFVLLSTALLAYLQLQSSAEATGKRIKELERERDALVKKVHNEEVAWSAASSVRNMERLMALHGIEMGWPDESQIIRVSALRTPLPDEGALYARK